MDIKMDVDLKGFDKAFKGLSKAILQDPATLRDLAFQMNKQIKTVRCSDHGQNPRIVVKGRALELSGCCQEVVDLAAAKLK